MFMLNVLIGIMQYTRDYVYDVMGHNEGTFTQKTVGLFERVVVVIMYSLYTSVCDSHEAMESKRFGG